MKFFLRAAWQRFELTGLPSPTVVEGGTIETSDNAAYMM